MITDKYLIRDGSTDKVLDKIERFAYCYDFKSKEIMQIRLLAEEIISLISPTLALSDGRCWIETDKKSFSVTIDCDAGIKGLDDERKKMLLKMGGAEKNKGIFGMISKVFEFLSTSDVDDSTVSGQRMFYSYGADSHYMGYYWNPAFSDTLPHVDVIDKKKEAKSSSEYDLEISIIEGCADDICVSLQKARTGKRMEITVVKLFHPEQLDRIKITNPDSQTGTPLVLL